MNALNLAIEDEVINLPTEQLKAGIYSVDIAYYSDNVAHSLIENEKAKATITVDNNGNISLSTDVINGTIKEPLYILDFNGYYKNNDLNNSLTMENANSYTLHRRKHYCRYKCCNKSNFSFRWRVFCNLQYKCQNVRSCYEIS